MKINAAWHSKHRMPKNATVAQRIKWHVAHAKQCGCRPIPPGLAAELRASARRGRVQGSVPSNKRLKLPARFFKGMIAFVTTQHVRRSLGANR
jgi:hypothetical protein